MSTPPAESLLAQWFRRVWNEDDHAAIDELCTPDMISHGLIADIHGPKAWRKEFYEPMRAAFQKVNIRVLAEVARGDTVMARMEARMTLLNGQEVTMPGFSHIRIVDGRIAEAWDVWDFAGVMENMRLLPRASFGAAVSGHLAAHPAV